MLRKTITYTDFNGEQRTEEFLFNISKSELMTQNLMTPGGLEEKLKRISNTRDIPELTKYIRSLILDSYGVKSDDGLRFIKSPELATAFSQTGAYDELFMELFSDDKKATAFVNAILPQDMVKQANTPKLVE